MSKDESNQTPNFLGNYQTDRIYINPNNEGKYITLVENFEISKKVKISITAFYVNAKEDFTSLELTKIKLENGTWTETQRISLNSINLSKIRDFLAILIGLNLKDATKSKIALEKGIDSSSLLAILESDSGKDLLTQIANQPVFLNDIYALGYRKEQLSIFHKLLFNFTNHKNEYIQKHNLKAVGEENIWQHFFEQNPWIFGLGLNYQFLHKVGKKLETATKGYSHPSQCGHRVDALMRTKAAISQYVFIELKPPSVKLLQSDSERSGCWAPSKEVILAISQTQNSVFDFVKDNPTDVEQFGENGERIGDFVYNISPKSYLIIGNLAEFKDFTLKFRSFQLFRNSLTSPEILTYDELYERAKCIVETLSDTQKKEPIAK